ncbi:hypothetical protein PMT22_07115, partial [Bifidobacterium longum]|nr:hypothetical protein [Bifidobacterium longum]MDB6893159.1 hypothetical protein [Bifidobacterium longum]
RHRGKPSAHTAEKHCRTCRTNIEAKHRLVEVGMGRSTARRLSGESARPAGKGRLERRRKPGSSVLLRCLLTGSVFPQCGLMVFPGNVIVSR